MVWRVRQSSILTCRPIDKIRLCWMAIVAVVSVMPLAALPDETGAQRYSLDMTEATPQNGDHPLALADSSFEGNPIADATGWWPEDLVLAPIPGYSPEFGWKLAIAGGYFLDSGGQNTPASLVGLFAMASENESNAYAAGGRLHFLGDRLRIIAALSHVDFNYRFWGVGNDAGDRGLNVDIRQQGPLIYLSPRYRLLPNLYVGLGFVGGESDIGLKLDLPVFPDFPTLDITVDIAALEFPVVYDTRDDEYFPRSGWLVNGRIFLYREFLGSDIETDIFKVEVNRYLPMREQDVLGLRAFVRSSGDDTPFFLLSAFGGKTDLRGYDHGRYRDEKMYAVQAEYRWRASNRWIFTGFAGVGEVAPSFDEFFGELLPAAGIGARFVLSPKHKLNMSFDVAVGNHGAQFYFGVGEAF